MIPSAQGLSSYRVYLHVNDKIRISWNTYLRLWSIGERWINIKPAFESLSAHRKTILQACNQFFSAEDISCPFLFNIRHVFEVCELFRSYELPNLRIGAYARFHNDHFEFVRNELKPNASSQLILLKYRSQWLRLVVFFCQSMSISHKLYQYCNFIDSFYGQP